MEPEKISGTGNFKEGYFDLVFKATNIGHAPAFDIHFIMGLFVSENEFEMLAAQKHECKLLRLPEKEISHRRSGEATEGVLIFPGESILNTTLWAEILNGAPLNYFYLPQVRPRAEWFAVWVYGCVDYVLSPGSAKHHQTGFAYRVGNHTLMDDGSEFTFLQFHASEPLPGKGISLIPVQAWAD